MTESKVDLDRVTELQSTLASEALETTPANVTKFTINATEKGGGMQTKVGASTPFLLNDAAVGALRQLFLLYRDAGIPLNGLFLEFAEKPDGTWSMATEYDYA